MKAEGFPECRAEDAIRYVVERYNRFGFPVWNLRVRWAALYVVSIDFESVDSDGRRFTGNEEVDVSGDECTYYSRHDPVVGGFATNLGC